MQGTPQGDAGQRAAVRSYHSFPCPTPYWLHGVSGNTLAFPLQIPTGSGANGSVMKDHVMMRRFVSVEALFNGRHFDRQIIILCVSWYTCFKLSFRDLV